MRIPYPENYHIHKQIYDKLEHLISLDYLRKYFRDCDNILPHHYLYFDNTHKTVDAFLYGFQWENSVTRITKFDHEDKEWLSYYIKKYEDQLIATNGSFYDMESLKFLQKKIKFKMSIDVIKKLILKYYMYDDDLFFKAIRELQLPIDSDDDDDSDEDDSDEDELDDDIDCKLIDKDYNTSPCKSKKKSE